MLIGSLWSLYVKIFCLPCKDMHMYSSMTEKLESKVGRNCCWTEIPTCIAFLNVSKYFIMGTTIKSGSILGLWVFSEEIINICRKYDGIFIKVGFYFIVELSPNIFPKHTEEFTGRRLYNKIFSWELGEFGKISKSFLSITANNSLFTIQPMIWIISCGENRSNLTSGYFQDFLRSSIFWFFLSST